jgi:hypothetical protein
VSRVGETRQWTGFGGTYQLQLLSHRIMTEKIAARLSLLNTGQDRSGGPEGQHEELEAVDPAMCMAMDKQRQGRAGDGCRWKDG